MSPEEQAQGILDPWLDEISIMTGERLEVAIATAIREAEARGLERAAAKLADWKDEAARQGMPAARQRWANAETAIRALKHKAAE